MHPLRRIFHFGTWERVVHELSTELIRPLRRAVCLQVRGVISCRLVVVHPSSDLVIGGIRLF